MHRHRIAHLDISLHNVLANYDGRYAFIDYEGSRRFDESKEHCMAGYRGTEVPPECERGQCTDPYKIDVWALAIFILRICKVTIERLRMDVIASHPVSCQAIVCPNFWRSSSPC